MKYVEKNDPRATPTTRATGPTGRLIRRAANLGNRTPRTPPILACRIRRSLILKSGSAPVRTVLEVRGSRLIHSWSAGTDTFPLETLLLED
jgi:hypothetical protein